MRKIVAASIAAALATVSLAGPALAAKPDKGKLSAATPTVKWTGTHSTATPVPAELQCAVGCESFKLIVEPIAGKEVRVAIDVPANSDFDVYIYGPDGKFVVSGGGGFLDEDEIAIIKKPKKGTYDVRVQPYFVLPNTTYKGSATFQAPKK